MIDAQVQNVGFYWKQVGRKFLVFGIKFVWLEGFFRNKQYTCSVLTM